MKMKVYINVYDILIPKLNRKLQVVGMGIFHTGIEISSAEYAYGGDSLVSTTGIMVVLVPGGCGPDVVVPGADVVVLVLVVLDEVEVVDDVVLVDVLEVPGPLVVVVDGTLVVDVDGVGGHDVVVVGGRVVVVDVLDVDVVLVDVELVDVLVDVVPGP